MHGFGTALSNLREKLIDVLIPSIISWLSHSMRSLKEAAHVQSHQECQEGRIYMYVLSVTVIISEHRLLKWSCLPYTARCNGPQKDCNA